MANDEHVAILKQGVEAWNRWRDENPDLYPDLSGADLSRVDANLRGANLFGADLRGANLFGADLRGANLAETDLKSANLQRTALSGADLTLAFLKGAKLQEADLSGAKLQEADLREAHLTGTTLTEADLTGTVLASTVFAFTSLAKVKGLDRCLHEGPSSIDFETLKMADPLPIAFLRGVGLPDRLIDYLPSLLSEAIQHYSCFISYSSKDQDFAERIHADPQNKGVRCWFAPHDMRIGAKIIDAIDEAIRLRDKVLLILSEGAISSDWVEGEVTRALDEERTRKQVVLFPLRLDDAVMQTTEGWARLLRGQRNIGDFSGWKEHHSYQKSFDRLMRDLRVETSG
jgi:TIR domain/Pentapeptide repeats (8 copies)